MQNTTRDLDKDAGRTHGPPSTADKPGGGAMDYHALNTTAMDGTDAGASRRPPALSLEASLAPPSGWNMTADRDREGPTPQPESEAAAYRARMLAKVGDDQSRAIAFTDEELAELIDHAKGLGFSQEDIEAILAVKVRKPETKAIILKSVTDCLAKKREDKRIRFKEGWDFMRAYRAAQWAMFVGNALEPEAYLDEAFVEEHREAFSGKASYLLHGENYEQFVLDKRGDYPELGFKGALYVSTASEIDRVLSEANGSISVIERLLGFSPGWLQAKRGIWRVDVHSPETKGLRIPNGFEATANVYWTPGALTSGGTMEAVLDQVPKSEANFESKQVIF